MGELRNSILALQKQVAEAAKMGDKLGAELEAVSSRVWSHYERQTGGVQVLWAYLVAMFEKNNRKIADHLNDKLSEHADSEITTYLKGIGSAADECLKAIGEFNAIKSKMPDEYARIDTLAATIRRNIDKKRAKLFQSKKYKAKLVGYEKALDELVAAIATRRKTFDKIKTRSPELVERYRIKPNLKLSDVESAAGIGFQKSLAEMKEQVDEGRWAGRKWRENGDLKNAFAQMKQWAGEADAMDTEVLQLDPDAVKPIKDVKLFQGKKLVGTAPKAVFQGKRPMEVPGVKWERGVDFLKLLQQQITLRAKYESGGDFVHDMKINGVQGGKVVKLT